MLFEEEQEPEFEIFSALLFNSLKAITFMFFISFAMINKPADEGKVDPKAEMLITVSWPDNNPDDVDTYVMDPAGNIVWYTQREAGLMHLDRDDRGMFKDVVLFNDKEVTNPLNQEIISFRGLEDGEYVVNVVHYIANGTAPLPVSVKVEKLNPSVKVVFYQTLELTGTGNEQTAVRFTLEGNEVVNVNNVPKSLVELTRSLSAKGGSSQAGRPSGPIDAATGQTLGGSETQQ
ncbi:hypothetical protein [Maritimibacter sp. UBA3975]|uniref:hypothetical protein n=1 Tax=Maritimibacter sp. UBA3975 TaxID=1946833 RepID=UPI000C0A6921|nr:hypothetical protein [Maritimibacter sp. UBA3975]MAM61776.1 hypothetical protein [Maritimibacter sp.]|tara:strand:+ start:5390 stop:6088 length:699 start_codon:yes stop_codon:yes gene_type:complete